MTDPWRVVEKLVGASYRLEHCNTSGCFDKKHASDLSPYPLELVPFEPINSPDNQRPIGKSHYYIFQFNLVGHHVCQLTVA
jgi:hypothetical protein